MAQEEDKINETIIEQSIEHEITQSYIDYAMSVIISRALPDVRDGLKPVLRRILFAMWEMRLTHNAKYRKSAAVVGEVLGKFHPHGDTSVYDALARLTQPFSLRYPLIDGQGNFGSIDGDAPAAMRYTEVRLTKMSEEMLQDIELDTVNWRDNYDNSLLEPTVLPTKFPNHLCNGTMGIAVGMATNMAPHNLGEIIDGLLLLIENKDATIEDIMKIIPGPDFPTGGIIYDTINIAEVYTKGKGGIIMRGCYHIEEIKNSKVIIIDEIPYQVNKSTLMMKIGSLIAEKKLEGVTDITDESSKNIIRISIQLRRGVDPESILSVLFKYTELQTNFNLNNVILTEKGIQPKLQNIKDLLREFIEFRREVILRRSKYLLRKAQERLHILEGLEKAINIIDEVIATIRASQTRQEAKNNLMSKFDFSDPQSEYILMLRLQTLVGLEINNILNEIKDKRELIEYLTEIINNPSKLDKVVIDELIYIKEEFADKRRTKISNDPKIYELDNNIKNLRKLEALQKEKVILRISNQYEIKVIYQSRIQNIPEDTYALNNTHNQDNLIIMTNTGELVIKRLKDLGAHNIKGKSFDVKKSFNLGGEIMFAYGMVAEFEYLVLLTNQNNIKKISKKLISSFKKFPTHIMNLEPGEQIIKIIPVQANNSVGLLSANGYMLVFPQSQIRPSGKNAGGIKGMDLEANDKIINMFLYQEEMFVFIYSQDSGKLISIEDCKFSKRARKGELIAELSPEEKIKGGIALDDGAVKIIVKSGEIIDLHSDQIKLNDKFTKLEKITNKGIQSVYVPWRQKVDTSDLDDNEENNSTE